MIKLFAAFTKNPRIAALADGSKPFPHIVKEKLHTLLANNIAVIGNVTYSIHGAIPGCQTLVVTNNPQPEKPGVAFVNSLDAARAYPRLATQDLWICGGVSIFDQALAQGIVDEMHTMEIWAPSSKDAVFDAVLMPSLRLHDFERVSDDLTTGQNTYPIRYSTYRSL